MEKNKSTQKVLELNGRKFILIGTAHVSKASISEVENAIEDQKPDSVAIELDENRLKNMEDKESWKKMDIIEILKKKQGFLLLANIVLSAYQKRMGEDAGIKPGDEMAAAIKKAKELGIPQIMVDRPVTMIQTEQSPKFRHTPCLGKKFFYGKMQVAFVAYCHCFFQRRSFGN